MGNRLYVGNLAYTVSDQELRREFEKWGNVTDVRIPKDRETGQSRGFGFVQFATDAEAYEAIEETNGVMLGGRPLVVKIAEEREARGTPSGASRGPSAPRNYPRGGQGYAAPAPQYDAGKSGAKRKGRGRSRDDQDEWS